MGILTLLALLCGEPRAQFQVLRLIVTSDLHCRPFPSKDFEASGLPRRLLGGWEDLARLVNEQRTDACLLLDCGDFAFGSWEGDSSQGRAAVAMMNRVGYDAAAAGARDFTGGPEHFELLAKQAKFPILADPMLDVVLNRIVPLFRPYVVKDVRGIRVGIVGLTDPEIPKLNRKTDCRGLVVDEPPVQLRRYLAAVGAESVDMVVAVGHIRAEVAALLLDSFPELDLLFCPAGQGTASRPVRDRLVLAGAYGQRLEVADVLFDRRERKVYGVEVKRLNVVPDLGDSLRGLGARAVGYSRAEFEPSEAGRLALAAVVAEAVRTSTAADIAILPLQVIESGLDAGELTRREIRDAVPFCEPVRLVIQGDTAVQGLLSAQPEDELAPALAGADYFVLGDTLTWPIGAQVAQVRFRHVKPVYRVATIEHVLERAGVSDKGRLIEDDLTVLWLRWAEKQDTIEPVPLPALFPASPGVRQTRDSAAFPVNINTAASALLEQLPGIGPKTAQRIIEYRATHGRFGSTDELLNVKGIGPKKLEKLRPLVTVK